MDESYRRHQHLGNGYRLDLVSVPNAIVLHARVGPLSHGASLRAYEWWSWLATAGDSIVRRMKILRLHDRAATGSRGAAL